MQAKLALRYDVIKRNILVLRGQESNPERTNPLKTPYPPKLQRDKNKNHHLRVSGLGHLWTEDRLVNLKVNPKMEREQIELSESLEEEHDGHAHHNQLAEGTLPVISRHVGVRSDRGGWGGSSDRWPRAGAFGARVGRGERLIGVDLVSR